MPTASGLLAAIDGVGRGPGGGVNRRPWTGADLELRSWFLAAARDARLDAETDRNGNLWAWWRPDAPGKAVAVGSHLDSVSNGGAFDGPLGIAGAFAAVHALRDSGFEPRVPIAVVAFADEEGSRFGVACAGSRLATGSLQADRARTLADEDGVTLAEAMLRAGEDPAGLGADPERLGRLGAFVELHIEQGHLPVRDGGAGLADAGAAVGVAGEIWPHGRWRLELPGRPNHAGTTPMRDRDDPVVAAATAVLAVRDAALAADALATVGRLVVEPGAVNSVAALARLWIDARGADEQRVRRLIARVERAVGRQVAEESWTPVTRFDPALTEIARAAASGGGDLPPVLPSGAGHDAGVLALSGVPAAMLLVRNPSGVSHAPDEYAEPADVEAGAAALAAVLRRLAG